MLILGIKDRFHESVIKNICETALMLSLYPRAAILMNIQEMHDNGTVTSLTFFSKILYLLLLYFS